MVALALAAPILPVPRAALAQERGALTIRGEVRIGDLPADSGTVVVHRVSAFSSGATDSVRVGVGGRFAFTIPPAGPGEESDVFFASIRIQEILYFGGPVTEAADTVGVYLIQGWPAVGVRADTRPTIRVRNTFLEHTGSGPGWFVTDYFEITNATRTTLIASEEGASWSHSLPPDATDFRVGESDLLAGAASFSGGRVYVSAPVQPGQSLYQLRYRLPGDDFTLPIDEGTGSMELLVREPAGALLVDGLAAVGQVDMEDGTWRRFAGRELAASVVTIGPGEEPGSFSVPAVAGFLLLALAATGAFLLLAGGKRNRVRQVHDRQTLLLDIARLDERWSRGDLKREAYERRRGRLLDALEERE